MYNNNNNNNNNKNADPYGQVRTATIMLPPPLVPAGQTEKLDLDKIADIFRNYGDETDDDPAGSSSFFPTARSPHAGGVEGVAPHRIVVEEGIRKKFKQDPLAAIQQSVAPYHDPEELIEFADKIDAIAEWEKHNKQTEQKLWKNPEVRFIRMVEAKTKDSTLLVRLRLQEIPGLANPSPTNIEIQRYNLAAAAAGGNANVNANNVAGDANRQPLRQAAPLYAGQYGVAGDPDSMTNRNIVPANVSAFGRERPGVRPQEISREFNTLKTVRALMEAPEVSGEYRMSDQLYNAVVQAMVDLKMRNPVKFANCRSDHFFKDELVMNLFADIVAYIIKLMKIHTPDTYNNNAVEPRRSAQLSASLMKAEEYLVFSHRLQGFEFASAEKIQANRRAIMQARTDLLGFNY